MTESEFKQLTERLESEYAKAEKILKDISELETLYQKAAAFIASSQTKLESVQTDSDQTAQKTKDTFEEIKTIRTEISGYLDSAKTTIDELQTLKEKASELKGVLTGQEGEITAILKNSRTFSDDIDRLKSSAQTSLDKTTELFSAFQKKVSEMQTAHSEFLVVKAKIDDKDTGLKSALDFVLATRKQSDEIIKNIDVFRQQASGDILKITALKKESEENSLAIKEVLGFVNETKKEVETISGLVIDGSFAETFEKRKKEIDRGLNSGLLSWKAILLMSVGLLIIAVLLPFSAQFGNSLGFGALRGFEGIVIRFFYTSPLVFLVVFSSVQYSKERIFLEKYAFKAASAAAIRNHAQFLLGKLDPKAVTIFIVEAFRSIYTEPFKNDFFTQSTDEDKRKNRKDSSDNLQKDAVLQLTKLKDSIPDEVVFKQVIEFLVSLRKEQSK